MKKIVLLGDSIRMGYDKYVKAALEGVAEVYYPSENCKFAQYIMRFMGDWKRDGKWPSDVDLVHWNAGLWDVIELDGEGPITSIEYYAEAVARVNRRLRKHFPKAKIVFATSTSVVESGYKYPDFKRTNALIEKFNEAAKAALSDTDTVINDLYSKTVDIPDEFRSDMTHFNTPLGTEYMGKNVLSVICRELEISKNDVNLADFEPEKYTDKNIGR